VPVRTVTLAPDTVHIETVPDDYDTVAVFHRNNTTEDVFVTVNDVDPVADDDDVYCVPAGSRRPIPRPSQTGASDVRLLSDGAVKVEIEFG
jgi:hypothetical protein